jgi:transcriptional regulator with XRE-family HTH domain
MARKPAMRHVLADVRLRAGLSQAKLAKLLGCSLVTVQRIEQGKLGLSEGLATKAQKLFDVSAGWLLANDPTQLAVTPRGDMWTKDFYELTSQELPPGHTYEVRHRVPAAEAEKRVTAFTALKAAETTALIHAMLEGAKGRPKQGILLHRLREALKGLEEDFPPDKRMLEMYEPEIKKAREAFNKMAKQSTDREMKRVWGDEPKK